MNKKHINDWMSSIKFVTFVFIIYVIITISTSIVYFLTDIETKLGAVVGSILAGLVVAIIQLIVSYQDYTRNEIFRKLHIIKIFDNRNKKQEYYDYIATASREIKIMGSTAVRFFRDFCVLNASAPDEEKIIIDKLSKGISVNILLPSKEYLSKEKHEDYNFVKTKIVEIKHNYPTAKFHVRYFDHTANHSIFMVDDSCVVGPIFPNLESKYTFSQQLKNVSELAKSYLTYFDQEWENAHE